MKIERTFTIGRLTDEERAIDQTAHLSGEERLALLEDIRRSVWKIRSDEYPRRIPRTIEFTRRGRR